MFFFVVMYYVLYCALIVIINLFLPRIYIEAKSGYRKNFTTLNFSDLGSLFLETRLSVFHLMRLKYFLYLRFLYYSL